MKQAIYTFLILLLFVKTSIASCKHYSDFVNDRLEKMKLVKDDLTLIRDQFVAYHTTEAIDKEKVSLFLKTITKEGTWSDVNYKSKRGGSWETQDHLKRLILMTKAFRKPGSEFYNRTELKETIIKGLNHWLEKDYQNHNWWPMQIGVPKKMAQVFILLGDELPDSTLQNARKILGRARVGMTGQNRVWLSSVVFMRGLLYKNHEDMKKASQAIWSELRVTEEEGIQIDGSFHQHGPQLQFANYGQAFGHSMTMWASIMRGTIYAMPSDKVEILGDYLINGPCWTFWNGLMDLNASGRQYFLGSGGHPINAIVGIRSQIKLMKVIDPKRALQYTKALDTAKQLLGHKTFWRTAFASHRRPNWYSSIRMSSTRVIGTETANYENMKGRLWGDGTLFTYVDGREYFDIAPLWNWRRLPGITADQRIIEVYPTSFNTEYGRSAFAGGITMGGDGLSAMELMRESVHANKAWFFEKDAIVCLGSDIYGYSIGNVFTSIQQSHFTSEVETPEGVLEKGDHDLGQGSWIHHAGIGYHLLNKTHCRLETVHGNWEEIFHTFGSVPAKGDVFSLWVDHGKSPTKESYAYIIYPDVNVKKLKKRIKSSPVQILENSKTLAAISSESGIKVVFFRKGSLRLKDGQEIESSHPCLLMKNENRAVISDPTRYLEYIELKINSKSYRIDLPQGQLAGSQVEIIL